MILKVKLKEKMIPKIKILLKYKKKINKMIAKIKNENFYQNIFNIIINYYK